MDYKVTLLKRHNSALDVINTMDFNQLLQHTLVLLGLISLILSIKPAYMMVSGLPAGTTKNRWKILLGLILTFITGYMVILFSLSNMPSTPFTSIVDFMLFGGGIFVWVLCYLSVDTVNMAKRLVELENENVQDSLMGIYNRRHLDCRIVEEFRRAKRYNLPLTYMMLDVDHFKSINDKFGHNIGDEVLVRLANILKEQARETDIVARYGGEEVGIICPLTDGKGGMVFADRVREKIDTELTVSLSDLGSDHNITVSIGVACMSEDVTDSFDFIKQADKALYQAKHNGRNCVILADICEKK